MKTLFTLSALAATAGLASGAAILSPGDTIIGGQVVGGEFVVGAEGLTGGVNNWPGAEPPADLINGLIGGGGEKYLNFAKTNTGALVTPSGPASIVQAIQFWVANDAPERDPSGYELWGTNSDVSGGGPFSIGDFTPISVGGLSLPDERDTTTDTEGFSQFVNFANGTAYSSYLLVFPDVKNNAAANSMQISEVQFYDAPIPEPSAALLAVLGLAPLLMRRRR